MPLFHSENVLLMYCVLYEVLALDTFDILCGYWGRDTGEPGAPVKKRSKLAKIRIPY